MAPGIEWFAAYDGLALTQLLDLAAAEDRPVRVIAPPNTMVTADFVVERLNVVLDADGVLQRAYPG